MFLANKLNKGGSLSSPDAQFNYVTMLLHGDGTNGAQNNTFLDSSTNNFTITRNGNTSQGSFSPYGSNWSNYFDKNGDYLTAPTPILSASGDFTIECWINATSSSSNTFVLAQFTSGSGGRTGFGLGGNTVQMFLGGSTNNGTTNISYSSWTHLAFTRSGTTFKAYVNGTLDLTVTSSVSIDQVNTNIGGDPAFSPALYFGGYISNMRVTNTVVYTGNFTPSTTPLTAVSGTRLLTCQSNRFIDNSTNNYTLTVNGNTSVQRFNPFGASTAYSTSVIGGSGYFDGTGDYLSTPSSSGFTFGTGDFTIEAWINWSQLANAPSSEPGVFQTSTTSGGLQTTYTSGVLLAVSGGVYNVICGTDFAGRLTSSYTVKFNTWDHVAIVRSSGTLTIYVNGVSAGSQSNTSNVTATYAAIGGYYSSAFVMNGYVSNFRVVKGTAVYTGAFTPPTAPLTAISGTQLLLSMTNSAIYDNAMMNDLETVGNAQISTSVKKYGTGSLAFDGNGDYLAGPYSPSLDFGTGDFTVELWFYFNGSVTGAGFIGSKNAEGMDFAFTSSSLRIGRINTAWDSTFSWSPSANTWYHIAFTRSNGTARAFVNGNKVDADSSNTNNYYPNGGVYVGVSAPPDRYVNGYIDDLRITKGFARYTANFTPPTAAFPNTGPI